MSAQDYIDLKYGTNKERDAKEEHLYYLSIIQGLLNQNVNLQKMLRHEQSKAKEANNG
jgi:hypothetical protein